MPGPAPYPEEKVRVPVTFAILPAVREALKKEAASRGVTPSALVAEIVTHALKKTRA